MERLTSVGESQAMSGSIPGDRGASRDADSCRRLMAAVLRSVLHDCRGSAHARARGYFPTDGRSIHRAIAYVSSTDRRWPFSFENLCDALDLDADLLRRSLTTRRTPGTHAGG